MLPQSLKLWRTTESGKTAHQARPRDQALQFQKLVHSRPLARRETGGLETGDKIGVTDPMPFAECFCSPDRNAEKRLVFVGLPDDSQSSYRRGCAQAPGRIRWCYDGLSYGSTTESGLDLFGAVADLGDWPSESAWDETASRYEKSAAALFSRGRVPFFAGGDHAVTVPVVAALKALSRPLHVLQFDAHGDLYDEYEGSRSSHACTAARILEMPHVASLTQLGVRKFSAEQQQTIDRHPQRLQIHTARALSRQWPPLEHLTPDSAVYVTLDLDVFDPAHAPGVSHPIPGGLSPREVLNLLIEARWKLVGMDAVEVNPSFDIHDQTAILAARLMHEAMGLAAQRE